MPSYNQIEINQGKPQRDAAEQQARIDAIRQGIAERDIELGRKRKEDASGLQEKDIQRRGVEADIAQTDAEYRKTIQAEQQGVMSAELHNQTLDSSLRQTANIWRAFQGGQKDLALKSLNDTHLVKPGVEFGDMRLEDSDQKGPDGKPIKMLTLIPKGDGKPESIPVPMLDRLEQQYGATYKVVDKSLVRVGHDGRVTPVYEPDQFAPNAETGVPFSKRTGQPAAAVGTGLPPAAARVQPRQPAAAIGTGLPPASTTLLQPGQTPPPQAGPVEQALQPDLNVQPPASGMTPAQPAARPQFPAYPLTRRQETHQDARVKQLDSEIRFYLTGSNSMAVMMPETQDRYNKLMSIGGALVRAGKNPEEARKAAVDQVERAEKLQRGGTGYSASGAYTGPAPWRQ
jgi:hypothetical protein